MFAWSKYHFFKMTVTSLPVSATVGALSSKGSGSADKTHVFSWFLCSLPQSLLLTLHTLANLSHCVTWQRTVASLNASSDDLAMMHFFLMWLVNNLNCYLEGCQHITSSCAEKRDYCLLSYPQLPVLPSCQKSSLI